MGALLQDLRYSLRTLWRRPGFTAVAVAVLALGVGANSAVFSVVNGVLLKPIGVKDPERLVLLFESRPQAGNFESMVAPSNFQAWRERSRSFESMAAFAGSNFNHTGGGDDAPEQLNGAVVSASLFSTLPAAPATGRDFTAEDERPGAARVVILSHPLWQRRFNSDPKIVDQEIRLDGNDYKVVGVMPPGFDFPVNAEAWTPLVIENGAVGGMGGRVMNVAARLRPGVTLDEARAEMNRIAAEMAAQNPGFNAGWGVTVMPIHEVVVRGVRLLLYVLLGAVAFVLLIACANVANLLLARAAARQREIAIRAALGASRLRIVRQLLTESVLLALVAGALGLLLAVWGVDALVALAGRHLPRVAEIEVDRRVLGYTLALSLLTGLVFGLAPALQVSKPRLNELLKEGIRSSPAGFGRDPLRSLLVVAEVALSLVLLVGAGLMIKSFVNLQRVAPGFDPRDVVAMQVSLPPEKYADERAATFYREALGRVRSLPGVTAAGATHALPWSGNNSARYFYPETRPLPRQGEEDDYNVNYRVITPGYFGAMRIPFKAGRDFDEGDTAGASGAVVVNEEMARRTWPGDVGVGKRIRHRPNDDEPWFTVVGVVGDVRHHWLGDQAQPEIYFTYTQVPLLRSDTIARHRRVMQIVVRADRDPLALVPAVRREVAAVDAELPLYNVKTMEERMGYSLAGPRFNTLLMGVFAAAALALSAVGLYGVMSYHVAQRTHEIGVRMALGAGAREVLGLVMRQGLKLILAGVVIGLIAASLLTRFLSDLLFQVSPRDPSIFAAVPLLLAGVATVACYLPARRATKVEPLVALRYE